MAQLGFNPETVEDQKTELLPPGQYIGHIIESDLIATKTGSGQKLDLTFEILEGPCAKRRVWESLNILNNNAQAQEIAQRELKRICAAVGHVGVLADSNDLHFKPMRLRIAVEEDKTGQYAPKNRVKGYEAIGGVNRPAGAPTLAGPLATAAPAAQPAQTYAQASGGSARPWK